MHNCRQMYIVPSVDLSDWSIIRSYVIDTPIDLADWSAIRPCVCTVNQRHAMHTTECTCSVQCVKFSGPYQMRMILYAVSDWPLPFE